MIIKSKKDSFVYNYEPQLTNQLDMLGQKELDEADVLKITLWKVGRFPHIDKQMLADLNKLAHVTDLQKDEVLIKSVLNDLLKCKGVRLPMASTYLRFINPEVFQIIDRHVWYQVYKPDEYKESNMIAEQIDKYFKYLEDLRKLAYNDGVRFVDADRYYFMKDKKEGHKLQY